MAETEPHTCADWRPPTDQDWRRLRTLLRDVGDHLTLDADRWARAEQDLRAIGQDWLAAGYAEHAARARELAAWVDDELGVLEGGSQRTVPLDDRGLFPGTLAR